MTLGERWVEAFVAAVDDGGRLTSSRPVRSGEAANLELIPGLATGEVGGESVQIGMQMLPEPAWDTLVESVRSDRRLRTLATGGTLDGDFASVLLPVRSELSVECSCGKGAWTCAHVAGFVRVLADLIDDDNFTLALLRGRDRAGLVTAIRGSAPSAAGIGEPRGIDAGIQAADAYRRQRSTPRARPAPVAAATHSLRLTPPAGAGLDTVALDRVVHDAAERARRMLVEGDRSGLELKAGADAVRRAAARIRPVLANADRLAWASGQRDPHAATTTELLAPIAKTTGLAEDELEAAARSWLTGGHDAMRALRRRWEPAEGALDAGLRALGSGARQRANVVAAGPVQLRLDEDGRWWRADADDRLGWVITDGPTESPAELVD